MLISHDNQQRQNQSYFTVRESFFMVCPLVCPKMEDISLVHIGSLTLLLKPSELSI